MRWILEMSFVRGKSRQVHLEVGDFSDSNRDSWQR